MTETQRRIVEVARANPGMDNAEIAQEVGCSTSTVWRTLNPERATEQARATRERCRDNRRAYDREFSAAKRITCETCGELCGVGSGKKGRISRRCQACIESEADRRRETLQRMWHDGASIKEIAAALGSTKNSVGTMITRMRAGGWDVPYRHHYESRRETT